MYIVYWSLMTDAGRVPQSQEFESDKLSDALKFTQEKRSEQDVDFVSMASGNPNQVGKIGVSDPSADYDWQKRRRNMPGVR